MPRVISLAQFALTYTRGWALFGDPHNHLGVFFDEIFPQSA